MVSRILYASVGVVILFLFLSMDVYIIRYNSMNPTLTDGDYVITISRRIVTLEKNDIVIVKNVSDSGEQALVKRIVAINNDTLDVYDEHIKIKNNRMFHDPLYYTIQSAVNNPITTYTDYIHEKSGTLSTRVDSNKIKLNEDAFFLVGDNQLESMDSRFWGIINKEKIVGKVVLVL